MSMITQRDAEKLWSDLRSAFNDAEFTLRRIVETKAWVPLGYGTFVQAWNDKMRGIRLASTAAKAVVAYAMLEEGLTPEEVVEQTEGNIGDRVAERLADQREMGIPSDLASVVPPSNPASGADETIRRTHRMKKRGPAVNIHVYVGSDKYNELRDIAVIRGLDLEDECRKAIYKHFRNLERAR